MSRRFEVDIGEIVFTKVDGLRRGDGPRIGRAFQRELSALLEQRPLQLDEPVDVAGARSVDPLTTGGSPDRMGRELARAVHRHLTDLPSGDPPCPR